MALDFLKSLLTGDEKIPAPGTEPTYDKNGIMTNPGNPWIGWPDPSNPKKTIPASGAQRRRVRRAEERRQAAQQRVGQRAYDRGNAAIERANEQGRIRRGILTGEIKATPQLLANVQRDEARRQKLGDPETAAVVEQDRRDDQAEARADRAEERRIRRFMAGKPRGKDLRESVMNEYSHYLPSSYWTGKNGATR